MEFGKRVLVASTEKMAEEMRKLYPGYEVMVQGPIPTGGNMPNRTGRPKGVK